MSEYRIQVVFWYMVSLVMGILCAKYCVFERVKNKFGKYYIDVCISILCLVFLAFFRKWNTYYLFDSIIAMNVCYLVYAIIGNIPIVKSIFLILGKNSMNGFLIHTFIFKYYSKSFIYSFKYFLLVWLVLIICTLIVSVLIEQVKKIMKYDEYTTQKINDAVRSLKM